MVLKGLIIWEKTSKSIRQVNLINRFRRIATRTKSYLAAQYHRIAARRGKKRAIIAVAHSILIIAYHLILRQEPYKDLGGDYFDKQKPEATTKRLVKRLEKLGYQVSITQIETLSPASA
jgi:transposase